MKSLVVTINKIEIDQFWLAVSFLNRIPSSEISDLKFIPLPYIKQRQNAGGYHTGTGC